MKTLTIVFPGTSMKWQHQANFLEMSVDKAHNMNEQDAKHHYFFADGVAVEPTDEHYIPTTIGFDPTNEERLLAGKTKNIRGQHLHEMLWGSGMRRNAKAAFDMIKHYTSPPHNMRFEDINIVGFSRGGCVSKILAQMLAKDPDLSKIAVNMALVDPVPGPGNNTRSLRRVPPNVKKYMVGLSMDESTIGFDPLDFEQTIFESPATRYCFLPFKGDHLGNNFWMADLIKNFLPANSPLYSTLPAAREKLVTAIENLPPDPERDARARLYNQKLSSYARKLTVETYYQYKDKEVSLQADASETIRKISQVTQKINIRRVKLQHHKYANNLFVNIHHEMLFSREYPAIYQLMTSSKYNPVVGKNALAELSRMPAHTRFNFNNKFQFHLYKTPRAKAKQLVGYLHGKSAPLASNCTFDELMNFWTYGKALSETSNYKPKKAGRLLSFSKPTLGGIITSVVDTFAFVAKNAVRGIKAIRNFVIAKPAAKKLVVKPVKMTAKPVIAQERSIDSLEPAELFSALKTLLLTSANVDALADKFPLAQEDLYLRRIVTLLQDSEHWLQTRKNLLQTFIEISKHPLIASHAKARIVSKLIQEPECINNLVEYPAFYAAIQHAVKNRTNDEKNLVDWFIAAAPPRNLLMAAAAVPMLSKTLLANTDKSFLLQQILAVGDDELLAFLKTKLPDSEDNVFSKLQQMYAENEIALILSRLVKDLGQHAVTDLFAETAALKQTAIEVSEPNLTPQNCWEILVKGPLADKQCYFNEIVFWNNVFVLDSFKNVLADLKFMVNQDSLTLDTIPLNKAVLVKFKDFLSAHKNVPEIESFVKNNVAVLAKIEELIAPAAAQEQNRAGAAVLPQPKADHYAQDILPEKVLLNSFSG